MQTHVKCTLKHTRTHAHKNAHELYKNAYKRTNTYVISHIKMHANVNIRTQNRHKRKKNRYSIRELYIVLETIIVIVVCVELGLVKEYYMGFVKVLEGIVNENVYGFAIIIFIIYMYLILSTFKHQTMQIIQPIV